MASNNGHCPNFTFSSIDVVTASTNRTSIGTSVSFSCKGDAHILSGSPVLACQESGNWNGSLPTCIPEKEILAETTTHSNPLSPAEWQSETVIIILWSVGGALLLILLVLLLCILQSHRKGRQARLSRSNSIFHIHGSRDVNNRQGGVNPGFSHSEEHWRWSFLDDLPPPPSYASLFEPAPDYETAITLGHAQSSRTVISNNVVSNGQSSSNQSDRSSRVISQRERLPTPVTERRNETVRSNESNVYQTIEHQEENIYESVDNPDRNNVTNHTTGSVLVSPQTASVQHPVSQSLRTPIRTASAHTGTRYNTESRACSNSSRGVAPNRNVRQQTSRHTTQVHRTPVHRTPARPNFQRGAPIRHPVYGPQHISRTAEEPPPAYSMYLSPPTQIRRGRTGQSSRQSRAAPLMRLEYEYF